jgi:hypothetical protein
MSSPRKKPNIHDNKSDIACILQQIQTAGFLEKSSWGLSKRIDRETRIPLKIIIKASMSQKLRRRLLARHMVHKLIIKGKCKGKVVLPSSLQSLEMGHNFSVSTFAGSVPSTLQEVQYYGCNDVDKGFADWINLLPAGLHTLVLRNCYTMPDQLRYPVHLKKLILQVYTDVRNIPFPPALETLQYWHSVHSDAFELQLPHTLRHLMVSNVLQAMLPPTLPPCLETLTMYSSIVDINTALPDSLEKIKMMYCAGSIPSVLPSKLKELTVSSSSASVLTQEWNELPPSLEVLDLSGYTYVHARLPAFPATLKTLHVHETYQHSMQLPENLAQLSVGRCMHSPLESFPASLRKLRFVGRYGYNTIPALNEGLLELSIEQKYFGSLGQLPASLQVLQSGHQHVQFTTVTGLAVKI